MDKFSRDLTIALQETSGFHKPRTDKLTQRRRSWSTGNWPFVPQPTEESSSSPVDTTKPLPTTNKVDILRTNSIQSDSDDKSDLRMLEKNLRLGTVESDSFNENFSPARLFKPSIRRKRKFKRMSIDGDHHLTCESLEGYGIIKKRAHKSEIYKSPILFSGKRKRSTKDRYCDYEKVQTHLANVPKQSIMCSLNQAFESSKQSTQSFSFTSQQFCDSVAMIKPLVLDNENISKLRKNVPGQMKNLNSTTTDCGLTLVSNNKSDFEMQTQFIDNYDSCRLQKAVFCRKKSNKLKRNEFKYKISLNEPISMEYGELYYFSSSSSLSSESDCDQRNDTDREGDDELTDWPGNERTFPSDTKDNFKRKLTKRSQMLSLQLEKAAKGKGGDEVNVKKYEYHIEKAAGMKNKQFLTKYRRSLDENMIRCFKRIETGITGEKPTKSVDLPRTPSVEVREIRAGCRRITAERLGFSIKSNINERLAMFLQDSRQTQIKLSDIKTYEHESLLSLSQLYSLDMKIDKGCAILKKTSKTTQSVNTDHHKFQAQLFLSDYKRRCYDCKGNIL